MGGNAWRKAKLALGLKTCLYVPPSQTLDNDDSSQSINTVRGRFSHTISLPPANRNFDYVISTPMTPTPSSSGLKFSKTLSLSSKKTCSICLTSMKPGRGHAIFTAECSHTFHFHCITSNVKHGNQICPVCRAKWKEIPCQSLASDLPNGKTRNNPVNWPQDDPVTMIRRLPPPRLEASRRISSLFHATEPGVFDDDELLLETSEKNSSTKDVADSSSIGMIDVTIFPEVSAVPRSTSQNNFTVLIHLKAPLTSGRLNCSRNQDGSPSVIQNSRAPVDLVTVLDVSGSMAGTKLALLKRAMGFVIQNLGPSDRLSVVAFSSTARRVFPLSRMTDSGRQQALQAVNSLFSNGGTNIAEGLKKGAKVMVDRQHKNPVSSIILLSDGQDTYSATGPGGSHQTDNQSLLPFSIRGTGFQIPVHAFGFGTDHDAASMHSISETSGGTFSFIEAEGVIQDAFAQCIGGLLSVVVQELQVEVECLHPNLEITSIMAGSYQSRRAADARVGFIDVGDLYAEEERDFLVTVNIPVDNSSDEMSVLKVKCAYNDPITHKMMTLEEELKIQRPERIGEPVMSMEVDRQRNRLRAAEAMGEARLAAENGDLVNAVSVLESCRRVLSDSLSAQAGDQLCTALCAELKEMKERMANRRVYEASGRAYVLSGLSSHSWQRATARGDSTDSTSLIQAYQTPSMVDMVTQSQTMVFDRPSPHVAVRPARSFQAQPQPR